MFYKNNKFSIRTYSFGAVSVIVGVFIALALGGNNVYASEATSSTQPAVTSTTSTIETTTPVPTTNTVGAIDNGDGTATLPDLPTPVRPGEFADNKTSGSLDFNPDNGNVDIEVNITYLKLGKIKLVDKATGNTIVDKVYANDNTDATKAADTILPKLPEGYKFVAENPTSQNATIEKYTHLGASPGKPSPIIKTEKEDVTISLKEVDGNLIFTPTNDPVSTIKEGIEFSYG